jgi:DNA invertase Pin-like site-specific DNA recombinase
VRKRGPSKFRRHSRAGWPGFGCCAARLIIEILGGGRTADPPPARALQPRATVVAHCRATIADACLADLGISCVQRGTVCGLCSTPSGPNGLLVLVDGYIRVSQVGGRSGPSFISPADQRRDIAGWAERHDAVVAQFFAELDESGARGDRPLLQHAIRRIEGGESDGLVVAYMSRFGRSTLDGLLAIRRITDAGGSFISVQEGGLDYGSDTGRFVLRHMLSVAEWDLDRIRRNWSLACERAIERGVYLGGGRPFGYRRTSSGRLAVDPVEGPVVSELFRLRASGARITELVEFVRDSGVPAARAGCWDHGRISRMLNTRVHLGEVRWGAAVKPAAHPALVDPETWTRAQASVARIPSRRGREPALLRGILRCAGCQRLLATSTKRPGTSEETRLYFCRGYFASGQCAAPAAVLDSIVEPYIEQVFWQEVRYARRTPGQRAVQVLREQLARRESELTQYRDNPSITTRIGPRRFAEGLGVRMSRVEGARLALDRATQAGLDQNVLPASATLRHEWPNMPLSQRRELVSQVFACAFVMRGQRRIASRLHVYRHGCAPSYALPAHERPVRRPGPFDPALCGRDVRLRAAPEEWGAARIKTELEPFVAGRSAWPSFVEFQKAGLALLHAQMQRFRRPTGWAAEFGIPFEGPRRFQRRWTDAEIKAQLRTFLLGKSTWPNWLEFQTCGREPLRLAVRWSGGPERWAREMGVSLPTHRCSPAYWTTGRITEQLAHFTAGRQDWPARSEFEAAGLLRLYGAISARKLRKQLATELGLALPAGKTKIVRPKPTRWTETAIAAALDSALAGREEWPRPTEMNRAGLRWLDQRLIENGTHASWARRYGVRPRPNHQTRGPRPLRSRL